MFSQKNNDPIESFGIDVFFSKKCCLLGDLNEYFGLLSRTYLLGKQVSSRKQA